MGIPAYFRHIVKAHGAVLKKMKTLTNGVDNLYLDSNSFVYDAVSSVVPQIDGCDYENQLISAVCDKIDHFITFFNPRCKIMIAFDGVAPVAKMNQQRERRYKSWLTSELQRKIEKGHKKPWNTSAITPGTNFMTLLHKGVSQYFALNDKVIVSSSFEPGEGEHKIFQYIRENAEVHREQTTIIYGLDADLIMLCLCHLHVSEKIFLYKDVSEFIQNEEVMDYYVDILEFSHRLVEYMMGAEAEVGEKDVASANNRIIDYILICFMLGNDFMPHFPALNLRTIGIDLLLDTYRSVIGSKKNTFLTTRGVISINWNNYLSFLDALSLKERDVFIQEHRKRDRLEESIRVRAHAVRQQQQQSAACISEWTLSSMDELTNVPILNREIEKFIHPIASGWERRYYESLFHVNKMTASLCKDICVNYMEGLEWTIQYYTRGCIDWRWTYKYAYAPLLSDLYANITTNNINSIHMNNDNVPVSPYVQLCYVLPQPSLNLLPSAIERALLNDPIMGKKYNTNHTMIWAYCKYFWESHTELPDLPIHELERICSSVDI
jgi:5'-3' exonuclease